MPVPIVRSLGRLQHRNALFARLGDVAREAVSSDGRVTHGLAAGLSFNAGGGNAGFALGTSEPEVQEAFGELVRSGDVVFDLGAASGFYTVIAARAVGPAGHVVAFEPFPENAERVSHNVALNAFANVTQVQAAVADVPGRAAFSLGADQNRGSLASVQDGGGDGRTIDVEVITLDDCVRERGLPAPTVLKIDIEGAEVAALRGARTVLAAHRPRLLIEVHGTGRELSELLDQSGYDAQVIEHDGPADRAEWGDHVVARPRRL